jgi:hypothetical protein
LIAVHPLLLETLFIVTPQAVLLRTQVVKVIPRENAAIVAITEGGLHGIVAHRL